LSETRPEDFIYHKERLLEPMGSATRGSIESWTPPAPEETPTPIPAREGYFDGLPASAASVGQGDLPTSEEPLLDGRVDDPAASEGPAGLAAGEEGRDA